MKPAITHTFTCRWGGSWWTNIRIYKKRKIIRTHQRFFQNQVHSTISMRNNFIWSEKQKLLTSFILLTPKTTKRIVNGLTVESKHPHLNISFESLDGIFSRTYGLIENDNVVLDLKFNRIFSSKQGTINLFTNDNIELLIYSIFLMLQAPSAA